MRTFNLFKIFRQLELLQKCPKHEILNLNYSWEARDVIIF